ncbi:MAG: hypothetical protein ABSF59_18935 [Candidatus Sulfotelmatobacter sp.]|jgi:hypothetical protein
MSQSVVETTVDQIAEAAQQASRASDAIADAIDDGVRVAKRAAKQGGDAAEELLNDTAERLQRHPLLTMVSVFAVGVGAGALLGWMIRRR